MADTVNNKDMVNIMDAVRKFKVVHGKSHMGKYNGMTGTATKVTPRQVRLILDGVKGNPRSYDGGYWFILDNVVEVK